MAVYVIVIVLVVLLLFAAYRSLGGSAPRPADTPALLDSLREPLRASLDGLSAWADAPVPRVVDEAAARAGRRRAAGVQQTLDSLPTTDDLAEDEAAVRALLAAAAEDAAWAWRMVQADGVSPGLGAAVIALRDHATECCAAADGLLGRAAGGEPGDRL
ncbi:MAG: hypothetical protein ABI352_08960 [Candidatus Dormibacter sp.]